MSNASVASIKAFFLRPLILTLAMLVVHSPAKAEAPLVVNANPFSTFSPSDGKHGLTGKLQFVGGFSFTSEEENLGGLSGLRILNEGERLLSVSDQGRWFSAEIQRDGNNAPIGFKDAVLKRLRDEKGNRFKSKKHADAEGLEVAGDDVLVSFERNHRVLRYRLKEGKLGKKGKPYRPAIPKDSLTNNSGLEAIVALNPEGSIEVSDATIAVFSEYSLDKQNNIRGFVSTKSGKWEKFSVVPKGDFKLTDAVKLDDQRILLLERRFSLVMGAAIQIRVVDISAIKKDALLDGPIVFSANMASRIDNLEGISVWQTGNAEKRISLISDDNFSALQSNLYLEFKWIEDPKSLD